MRILPSEPGGADKARLRKQPGAGSSPDEYEEWARVRDSLKTRWVAAVLAFWVSTLVLGAVSLIRERLDLVLVSICLGLLIVGLWLKSRYRLHLRRGPGGP